MLHFVKTMPRLSNAENTALNIVDYLFFHDVASVSNYSAPKHNFYNELGKVLNNIILAKPYIGRRGQLYRHFLLCGLEIMASSHVQASNEIFAKDLQQTLPITQQLLEQVEEQGFDRAEFNRDLYKLEQDFKIEQLDKSLSYKLVAQFLWWEYDFISLAVFAKFLDLKILTSGRRLVNKNPEAKDFFDDADAFFDQVFLRAMLLIEFEIIKRQVYLTKFNIIEIDIDLRDSLEKINDQLFFIHATKSVQDLIGKPFKGIAEFEHYTKPVITQYIIDLLARLKHRRLYFDNRPDSVGLMGSLFVSLAKEENSSRPTHKVPIEPDKFTCTSEAQANLNKYGFKLDARTLNKHYKKFYSTYFIIHHYFKKSSDDQIGLLTPDLIHEFFINKHTNRPFDPLVESMLAPW